MRRHLRHFGGRLVGGGEVIVCCCDVTGFQEPVLCLHAQCIGLHESHFLMLRPQNPGVADLYTEHSVPATVACYAPSGFYIASGGG